MCTYLYMNIAFLFAPIPALLFEVKNNVVNVYLLYSDTKFSDISRLPGGFLRVRPYPKA